MTRLALTLTALALVALACGTQASDAGDEVTITVWHTESTPVTLEAFQEIADAYAEQNPGVTVSQENVAWGDLQVKLQAGLSAGDPPEITHVEPMFVRALYEQELLAPVTGVVESIGDDYLAELRQMFAFEDGEDYGVVHAWGTDLITYRTDLYDQASVRSPEEVETWQEWIDDMEQVVEAHDDVTGLSLAGGPGHHVNEEVYMWLGSNGGRLFDDQGQPTIDTPEMVEVLEFWRDLRERGVIGADWASAEYPDTLSNLALGQTASILSFGRATYTFEEQNPDIVEEDLVDVAASKPVGPSGEEWVTQLDAEPWVVFRDAPAADQAQDFLEFFYEPEQYLKWIASVPTHLLPVRESTFDDPEYQALPELEHWDFWVQLQRQTLADDRARPMMVVNWDDMALPYLTDLYGSPILTDMVKEVVEDGVEPEQAAARAQERAEELLSGQLGDDA